jgi:DNA transformation protein and related proteins
MARRSALVDYLLDQLMPLGQPRGRPMFGGHGLYLDGLFVGIVSDETVYLKADQSTQPDFERAGMQRFVYESRGRRVSLSFWQVPAEVVEDPEALCHWVSAAARVAARALAARPASKPWRGKPGPKRRPSRYGS